MEVDMIVMGILMFTMLVIGLMAGISFGLALTSRMMTGEISWMHMLAGIVQAAVGLAFAGMIGVAASSGG